MKLNLGCGSDHLDGWTNVDRKAPADQIVDLAATPWPWADGSVDQVKLIHTLEHLGTSVRIRLAIMAELYRVMKPGGLVQIVVPHPRHDHFLNDPTHVWPVTPDGLALFDQELNRAWQEQGASNSTLGLDLGVDFRLTRVREIPDPAWAELMARDWRAWEHAKRHQFNVIQAIEIDLETRKDRT
jgi:SAM-dependent methyltransferase